MSGEVEYGNCDICNKETVLIRTYYHYNQIKCECHSPHHFEIIRHCNDCIPKEPEFTKVVFKTSKLHLLGGR